MSYEPRDALGIANRALRNLDIIKSSNDGHVVVAIISTSLALLLLPWEGWFKEDDRLIHLVAGPAVWHIESKPGDTLSDLRHLRNAFAHGGIEIESVSRVPAEVTIRFSDRPDQNSPINWTAQIQADDLENYLRSLCVQLETRFQERPWS